MTANTWLQPRLIHRQQRPWSDIGLLPPSPTTWRVWRGQELSITAIAASAHPLCWALGQALSEHGGISHRRD